MCDTINTDVTKIVVEKIGEYKKAMKAFIKSAAKAKLFLDEKNNLNVLITKRFIKEANYRDVTLTVSSDTTGVTANFVAEVPTRVFNKVEPALFENLVKQLKNSKNSIKLIVE